MQALIDRLRANLHAAGIQAEEDDLAGIEAKGFLSRISAFEELLDQTDHEILPDYLGDLPPPPAAAEHFYIPPAAHERPGTLLDAGRRLRAGEVSALGLVDEALAQVAARDRQLNAFQQVLAERARQQARQADRELAEGTDRGPLHGIPVALKDLFDLNGEITSAGSRIRAARVANSHSTVAERLEAAGAIIIGKTRMSEFAFSPGSNNAHYGPTANPFAPDRDSGGSSSGSAVAAATGMALLGIGSDTGGSIRIPAAHCGLVGLKPTFGRISLAGAVTLSWSLDHGGPLARSSADAATALLALAGPDPRDPRTLAAAPPISGSLAGGVRNLRVGVIAEDGTGQPLADSANLAGVRRVAEALTSLGAVVEPFAFSDFDRLRLVQGALLAMEALAFHLPHIQRRSSDLGEFMRQRIIAALTYRQVDVVRAQQARRVLRARSMQLWERFDLLLAPVNPVVAPPLGTPTPTTFTGPFNLLGWPALSLPAGRDEQGIPVGAQLIARPWDEGGLLAAAFAVELRLG